MSVLRRTKIVVTLGPSLDHPEILEKVILAGAVLFRANFSHGDVAMHEKRIQLVRDIAARHQKIVAILIDLQGPKIRIGRFESQKIALREGDRFTFDTELSEHAGTQEKVALAYKHLPQDVTVG